MDKALSVAGSRALGRADLLRVFLGGKSERTVEAYRADVEAFASWSGCEPREALRRLLAGGHGAANASVMEYQAHLLASKYSPATVNRRVDALRSVVKLARVLGMVPWTLEVKRLRSKAYRDTRGCGVKALRDVLYRLSEIPTGKATRDAALLRLLFRGLRRGELVALDVADVDLDGKRVFVVAKGKQEREPVTIGSKTTEALREWLDVRGGEPGPLFRNVDHRPGKAGARMTGAGVYAVVKGYDLKRPHGLRHAGVTEALDRTGGDYRRVRAFSRHANVQTVIDYDDNRTDLGGEVAELLDAAV